MDDETRNAIRKLSAHDGDDGTGGSENNNVMPDVASGKSVGDGLIITCLMLFVAILIAGASLIGSLTDVKEGDTVVRYVGITAYEKLPFYEYVASSEDGFVVCTPDKDGLKNWFRLNPSDMTVGEAYNGRIITRDELARCGGSDIAASRYTGSDVLSYDGTNAVLKMSDSGLRVVSEDGSYYDVSVAEGYDFLYIQSGSLYFGSLAPSGEDRYDGLYRLEGDNMRMVLSGSPFTDYCVREDCCALFPYRGSGNVLFAQSGSVRFIEIGSENAATVFQPFFFGESDGRVYYAVNGLEKSILMSFDPDDGTVREICQSDCPFTSVALDETGFVAAACRAAYIGETLTAMEYRLYSGEFTD